jgi:phage repressor protein C with HTH and peptisase S24 domain
MSSDLSKKMINFSKKLDIIRNTWRLKTSGLEKRLGLSNGYINNFLQRDADNPGKLLIALAENGVSTDWFLTGEGEMFLASIPAPAGRELAKPDGSHKVPLLRQKVSCGPGVDWRDEANIADHIDVFDQIPRLKIERLFALCVQGSSMLGAGIRNGDYVLFDSTFDQWLHDGIYVFAFDGEVYCKRLEFDMTKIKIYSVRFSDLDKAELMVTLDTEDISTADRLTIFGRVLYWVHPNLDDD